MIKNNLIYIIVFILVGITVWFFIQKGRSSSRDGDMDSVFSEKKEAVSLSSSPVPSDSDSPKDWIKMDNGLKMQDIIVGAGQEAKSGDMIAAHYTGTLNDGTKFDSSYDRGQPFAFVLGGREVITGWDLGVVGMKVGGKRKLIIPPDLGYGSRGAGGGRIPSNATLFFEIELVAVQTPQN